MSNSPERPTNFLRFLEGAVRAAAVVEGGIWRRRNSEPNDHHQQCEPAAKDSRIVNELNGWLASGARPQAQRGLSRPAQGWSRARTGCYPVRHRRQEPERRKAIVLSGRQKRKYPHHKCCNWPCCQFHYMRVIGQQT